MAPPCLALVACLSLRSAAAFVHPLAAVTSRRAAALVPYVSRGADGGFVAGAWVQGERGQSDAATTGPMTMGVRQNFLAAAALAPALANPLVQRVTWGLAVTAAVMGGVAKFIQILDTPSRPYDRESNTVGAEYDTWTEDGILEAVWGEHIHLGYYTDEERRAGYLRKDIVQAKYDFIDRMMDFGQITGTSPGTILDVGCGIGGTSRYLASRLGDSTKVTGITLSPNQVKRGTELAAARNLTNVQFKVMDALEMTFPDNSFDLVWACESGEHMPDKKQYIEEMVRVLKPGGRFVMATWCQRDNSTEPFTENELSRLDLLYNEWTHPYFISIEDYAKLLEGTGAMQGVTTADWAKETLPSWRHTIIAGLLKPWIFLRRPKRYWRTVRDAWCIERMHQAFSPSLRLMRYGMFTATKKPAAAPAAGGS